MNISERSGLRQESIAAVQDILNRSPKIERVILYGSRAKGNFRPGSDIDLVLSAESMTTEETLQLEIRLDDLLLPYKIDLSLFHQIENPDLLDHIRRVGIQFWP